LVLLACVAGLALAGAALRSFCDDPGSVFVATELAVLTVLALCVPTAMLLDWGRPPERPRLTARLALVAQVVAKAFAPLGLVACLVMAVLIDAPWWFPAFMVMGCALALALLALLAAGLMHVSEWLIYCLRARPWRAAP
jgi:hypothetical protein